MEKITCWSRYNQKSRQYEHNHIEDGHTNAVAPEPKNSFQKSAWSNAKWKAEKGFLINGVVSLEVG